MACATCPWCQRVSAPAFCRQCGTRLKPGSQFCPSCGKGVTMISRPESAGAPFPAPPPGWTPPPSSTQILLKNPGTAAVIALIAGVLLFWGVGHIYVGRVTRGICIMIAGWVAGGLLVLSFLGLMWGPGGIALIVLFALLSLGGWIWQTFDAYSLAKQYNDYVRAHGTEPW